CLLRAPVAGRSHDWLHMAAFGFAHPPFTSSCVAWFLTGQGLVQVCGPRFGEPYRPDASWTMPIPSLVRGEKVTIHHVMLP
uniref:Uncharacterized protein n=1 Tax=Laticauda laticaudata TaxID=8630 RepID=A0A8C5SPN4_LATLA